MSLFGSKPTSFSTSQSTLFGSNNNNNNQTQNNPSTMTSSLFGNNNNNNNQASNTGSLFGNNNNNNQASNTGSLFGNNNNNQASNTGSLFGNNNNQPATTTGSLFGTNNNQPATNNSLFGNNNNNNQTATSGSLFGSNNNNNQQPSSTLFGNNQNNQSSSSSSLFGSSNNNNNNNNQTSSLFGSNNQPSSLFSSSNNNNNNNNTTTQTQASSLFNSSSSLQPLLGSSSTSTSLIRTPLSNSIQTKIKHQVSIEEKIMKVYQAWNLSDPGCAFHYFFYNLVQPDQIHLYQRPQLSQDERRWELAKRSNPDPNRMVPVLAIGFQDLIKRQQAQVAQANLHLDRLIEFSIKLNEIVKRLTLTLTPKLHQLRTQQSILSKRLINLIIRLPISSNSVNEDVEKNEALLKMVFQLSIRLQKTGGRAKVSELWSYLSLLKNSGLGVELGSKDSNSLGRWTVTDDREIKKVLEVLRNQQIGIDHLMNVLRNDLEHYKFMADAFQIESN